MWPSNDEYNIGKVLLENVEYGVSATAVATEIFAFAFYCHIALLRRHVDDDDSEDNGKNSSSKCFSRENSWFTALDVAKALRLNHISFIFPSTRRTTHICKNVFAVDATFAIRMVGKPCRIFGEFFSPFGWSVSICCWLNLNVHAARDTSAGRCIWCAMDNKMFRCFVTDIYFVICLNVVSSFRIWNRSEWVSEWRQHIRQSTPPTPSPSQHNPVSDFQFF